MADLPLHFHPLATDEAEEGAHAWYSERSASAAALFLDELDDAIERIRESPDIWPRVLDNARRCVLRSFPFGVVYYVKSRAIEVIAVAHHRRKPGYWKRR